MIQLNLKAESQEFEALKAYLEENVSEVLAKKINDGVYVEKDGKRLLNKKDLTGFMKYACEEARKLSAKGASSACVKDEIVFGWAMHYFEENDIIGKLYNEDGSEYKPTPKKPANNIQRTPAPVVSTKPTPPKPQQFNLFEMMAKCETPTEETSVEESVNQVDETIDISKLNVDKETGEILPPKTENTQTIPVQASPLYQNYMRFQNQYPHAVIAYRLGDFFEIFGDNAAKIANAFNLTLTGRNCGLEERVPMVGFPYHASDMYFHKIAERFELVVVEDNVATPYDNDVEESPTQEDIPIQQSTVKVFEQAALCSLLEIFGDEMIIPEEDY